ncbi:hypothetical protein MAPG_08471 [Magnaporthiopsis poae ATCC 64411]|uniref:Uncharacterized protein n=1 Tax=Magnaporthiopsis poae (strain ATCC 64411 / 73-15) TaxID=644358 RepID=A0A0C4E7F8_MAGP6|nr:hypothetical protein MAPG_08471 [Magnaporthiopsis poae ATCC 64411]
MHASTFIAVLTAAAGLVSAAPAGTAAKTPDTKTPAPAGTAGQTAGDKKEASWLDKDPGWLKLKDYAPPQFPQILYPEEYPVLSEARRPTDPAKVAARKKVAYQRCTSNEMDIAVWKLEKALRPDGTSDKNWVQPWQQRKKPEDGPMLPKDWVNPCKELIAKSKPLIEAQNKAKPKDNNWVW